eukprot:TRINITY_DN1940_c0_g2_i1.p1 TRINITY_DN1940_c0_g2~~TRINITY_DN1940_c0_g2_i1.p1  ORF type:complete len:395 (+),score=45.66 TRINITY_DN1940_c0_g2_i1:277-1461(+)
MERCVGLLKYVSPLAPSLISRSSLSLQQSNLRVKECGAYTHYFTRGLLSFRPLEDDLVAATRCVSAIDAAAADPYSNAEAEFTANVVRALDRFLFDQNQGKGLHCSVTAGTCIADFVAVTGQNKFTAVGDGKLDSIKRAHAQTAAYVAQIATARYKDDEYPIIFGLPFTKSSVRLEAYYTCADNYKQATLIEAKWRSAQMLLAMLKHAVLNCPPPSPIPLDKTLLFPDWDPRSVTQLARDNVLLRAGKVWKVYPSIEAAERVLEMIQKIDLAYLPGATVIAVKPYAALQYDYIETTPPTPAHCSVILNHLRLLHAKGYVHGDVRSSNIIWAKEPSQARLIDFDLAAAIGNVYPENYGDPDKNRHPTARKRARMQPEHDLYSLQVIEKALAPNQE